MARHGVRHWNKNLYQHRWNHQEVPKASASGCESGLTELLDKKRGLPGAVQLFKHYFPWNFAKLTKTTAHCRFSVHTIIYSINSNERHGTLSSTWCHIWDSLMFISSHRDPWRHDWPIHPTHCQSAGWSFFKWSFATCGVFSFLFCFYCCCHHKTWSISSSLLWSLYGLWSHEKAVLKYW